MLRFCVPACLVAIAFAATLSVGVVQAADRVFDRTACLLPLAADAQPRDASTILNTPELRFADPIPGWSNYLRVWRAHHADPTNADIRRFLTLPLSTADGNTVAIRSIRGRSAPSWIGWRAGTYQQIDTPHLTVYSHADAASGRRVAEDLERCYWVWTQMFFPLWEASGQVTAALSGMPPDADVGEYLQNNPKRLTVRRKLRVVLFRDAAEYQQTLGQVIPGIERSTGFYNDERQTAFFFAGSIQDEHADDAATRRHEMVHQLFREATRSGLGGDMPGEQAGFWLVEGIAGYCESLHFGSHEATVGGWDSPRLQFARFRSLVNQDVMPIRELAADGRVAAQQRDDLARWYAHAIAQTHHLMDSSVTTNRQWLYRQLASLYRVRVELPGSDELPDVDAGFVRFLRVDDALLAANPVKRPLRQLCLAQCDVTGEGLATVPPSQQLNWLDLSRLPIDAHDVARILPAPTLLTQLSLEATRTDESIRDWLTQARRLEEVDLSFTRINDDVVDTLGASADLQVLWLTGCPITDRSISSIAKMKRLQSVDLQRTQVSEAGLDQLRRSRPDLNINPLTLR
ncbi:leucine-rich repeat domain-containing protein [Stieleria varia]|uniref:Leucine Rich repeats (2 copies) n=2 Tax=Stieleria varia TaxID=2528005 RepID=A0A5C6AN59_9BACT|nr:hypothetical protein [Stieleria varia]TWU00948.1 Leucine Rich repeats (2 copies) [Stieleria varia]